MFKGTGVRFLRRRSPEHVVRELKIVLSQKQYHFISFWDDMFDNDIEWLSDFSRLYSKEIGLPYGIAIHTHLVSERMVKLLKDSGCHSVGVGIQTGSARINREIYRRPFRREKVLEAVSLLNPNFDVFYDLIVENPYETEAEILETIDLFSLFPHPFKMSANTLLWFPGQEITRRAIQDGKITEANILGHAPDAAHAYRDITHPKFQDDVASRRRHSLYLIAFAMQHPMVDRDQVLGWIHEDALLEQPYEVQRRLALMYLHESESDILDLQAAIAKQNVEIATLRQELDRKSRSLESSRAFI